MQKSIFRIVFSALVLSQLFTSESFAVAAGDISFHLPINFRTRSVSQNGGGATTTQFLDVVPSVGYQVNENFYVGANYRFTDETGSGGYKLSGGVYGPSIGITASNFSFTLAYYVGGSLTESNSGAADITYTSGTGPEVSVGYLFPVAASFAWGPSFMYSDIKYTSRTIGSSTDSQSYEISGIEPYLALYFYF